VGKDGGSEFIEEELEIERDNDHGDQPAEELNPARIHELTHFNAITGESHQGPDSEA
jgi:hypothetical protein